MAQKPPASGMNYSVKPGEWTGQIALRYGYTNWCDDVWSSDENASLRDRRADPHVLAQGDVLFIPPWQQKQVGGSVDQEHVFCLNQSYEALRIRLLDMQGQPLKNVSYQLSVDHGSGTYKQKKTETDDDGLVDEEVPTSATRAVLKLDGTGDEIEFKLGRLDPLNAEDATTRTRAVQQRLTALGYGPGPIDGNAGRRTNAAIKRFQQYCKDFADTDSNIIDPGPVDGIAGPRTLRSLAAFYGC
jgi:hypothetical protein